MAIQTRRQSLTQARLLFNQQGAVPGGMVAEPILRSWRRCADLGFDMRGLRPAEPLTQAELREAREREALRRMSDPAMAELRKRAHGQGGLVILSDSRGLVLDCGGDLDFAQRASRIALMPGSPWDEAAAGTNAIGTALVEGRSIVVHGAEHYFEPNRILTCAAVPVCDSQGRILGVLDLSSQAGGIRPDALALVRAAVDQIEHRLFAQAHERDTVLRLHADPAGLGAPGRRCWPSGATCWSGPTGWRCGRWNSRPRRWACIAMKTCSKTRWRTRPMPRAGCRRATAPSITRG